MCQSLRFRILLVWLLGLSSGAAHSDDWTSPDGFISLTVPDAETFTQVKSPPEPMLALWSTKDEVLRFGVLVMTIPTTRRLIRDSVEEGFAKEFGAGRVDSATMHSGGVEIWLMSAESSVDGLPIRMSQSFVQIGDRVYKLMAVRAGGDASQDAVMDAFVRSVQVNAGNIPTFALPRQPRLE